MSEAGAQLSLRQVIVKRVCTIVIMDRAMRAAGVNQAGEPRKRATSQRSAAALRAPCQRSPATSPRPGSTARKTSLKPCSDSQSRSAKAAPLLALEWLMNSRATIRRPRAASRPE